jgi:uncharacterized protein (DUF1330 family)
MPAYVIVSVKVTNDGAYDAYRKQVPATLAKYGGKFLVRGGEYEQREGHWKPNRVVVLEFADRAAAKRWYDSPEYQEILKIRQANSVTDMLIIVDGAPPA